MSTSTTLPACSTRSATSSVLFCLNGVPTANTWNLRDSEGLSVIAGLGSAIGTQLDVLTEHSFNPHSIVLLTDASKVSPGSTRGDDAWSLAA